MSSQHPLAAMSPHRSAPPSRPIAGLSRLVSVRALPAWATAGALALTFASGGGCDSTAKFGIPTRSFSDLQVVTVFPAVVEDNGNITRVCGAPLQNDPVLQPNGVEFTRNLVSTTLSNPACADDRDVSVKHGEVIERRIIRTGGADSTVVPSQFKVNLQCVEPRTSGVNASCPTGITVDNAPSAVNYKNVAARCNPQRPETWLNVALMIDNTGSTTGFVDSATHKEDSPLTNQPDTLSPSDPADSRLEAARTLVRELNDQDRLIGYYFNEKVPEGVAVAASDNLACVGGSSNGKACTTDADCGTKSVCVYGGNPKGNSFENLARPDAEKLAFGNQPARKGLLLGALEDTKIAHGGEGRSPLWKALSIVHKSMTELAPGNRHVVVLTDGPDTCTHGEDLTYVSSDGKCRTPCQTTDVDFAAFRQAIADANYPVKVHFIQWQAKGYMQPDAQMMEIACRTGGTYQFLNFQEMNLSSSNQLTDSMRRAVLRVRYALSGSWRVGLKLQDITPPHGQIATGEVYAANGTLQYLNSVFDSLANTVYKTQTSWKFGIGDGNEDRRLLFRRGCAQSADCGGGDACTANHCDVGGTCRKGNAPDKMPCGGNVCCTGVCQADCPSACK